MNVLLERELIRLGLGRLPVVTPPKKPDDDEREDVAPQPVSQRDEE